MSATVTAIETVTDTRVCWCGWLAVRCPGAGAEDERRWFECQNQKCRRVFHDARETRRNDRSTER